MPRRAPSATRRRRHRDAPVPATPRETRAAPYRNTNTAPAQRITSSRNGARAISAPIPPIPNPISSTSIAAQIDDDQPHMPALQPLPQHERVLRADRDDQARAEPGAGQITRQIGNVIRRPVAARARRAGRRRSGRRDRRCVRASDKRLMSILKRRALNTCGTRQRSATVGVSPKHSAPTRWSPASRFSSDSKPISTQWAIPRVFHVFGRLDLMLQILEHAQVVERMDLARDLQRDRAHERAIRRRGAATAAARDASPPDIR